MIKSHGQRLDLAPCRSHQWASSCLVRIIHDGSSSPSLTLPHSMGEGEGGGPSWGFYKGARPLVEVGEAGFRAEPATGGRHP